MRRYKRRGRDCSGIIRLVPTVHLYNLPDHQEPDAVDKDGA
jgi:hypothetical protein